MKKTKKIPYEQALKLAMWRQTYLELRAAVDSIQRRIERGQQKLKDVHEFTGIPLDGADVKLEAGPDKQGLVEVEWEELNEA